MVWANKTRTKAGDLKVLYSPKTDTFNLLEADGSGDFVVLKQNKSYRVVKKLFEELINEQGSNFEFNESVKEFEESIRRSYNLDLCGVGNNESSNSISRQIKRKSENAGVGDFETDTTDNRYSLNQTQSEGDKRYSLKDKLGNNGELRYSKKKGNLYPIF